MWVQQVGCGVQAITFARDGRTLYTVDTNGRLIAWDTSTRAQRVVAFEIDWRELNTESFLQLVEGRLVLDVSGTYTLIDPVTRKSARVQPRNRYTDPLSGHVFADGRAYFVRDFEYVVTGVNLTTGDDLPQFKVLDLRQQSRVWRFRLSPDERTAFVYCSESVGLMECEVLANNRLVQRVPLADLVRYSTTYFAPDGRTVALLSYLHAGGSELALWDTHERAIRAKPIWCASRRIAFNPVLPLFAVPHTANTVAVRSLETGELVRELDFALGKQITSLAFAPDGLTCAVGGTNKRFAVFDVDV